tara:strand:+ start:58241 stop:58468 length:228 start_codon:yes stop_codon:yes gene_type:complete
MSKSRILFKSAVGEFASDWEERTDLELQDLHAAVQMIMQGEMAYISLISKKSTFYISEEMVKHGVILIQVYDSIV